ncbi:MAG: FAD-dependent oxidoreductase [Helicobacteraceae bacterium]
MAEKHYEVIVVGGGITGAALAYELARYTDIKRIAVLEKYNALGLLNSAGSSNSQTIHFGDIETNYTVEKAAITRRAGKMVERYCLNHNYQNKIIFSHQKMALGVGDEEVKFMLDRYESFKTLFPALQVWDKEALKTREPKIVFGADGKERKDNIVGVGSEGEWTTVNYGAMTESLIENAKKEEGKTLDLFVNARVNEIKELSDGSFRLNSEQGVFTADFVVVDAGAHSLFLAHKMGYGKDFGSLTIAGSFYIATKKILNGKVYMVQNPKLPFAALHGDPDILVNGYTRFGPTALVLPKLERYRGGTVLDFFRTLNFDGSIAKIFYDLLKDKDIRDYIFRNFIFEIPYFNKKAFLKDARKIVPSLRESEIEYASGFGGIRPQVLNKKEKRLMLGETSINPGNGIIFNMTPSPGATSCFANALRDLKLVTARLNKTFYEDKFTQEMEIQG